MSNEMTMLIRPFSPVDEPEVIDLWIRCGLTRPWNNPHADIERKLAVDPDLFLVGEIDGAIVATVMGGYEGHRGWINYLAVDPVMQRRGLGRQMMGAIEPLLLARGCPKINLQVRDTNQEALGFYRAIGYAVDPVISFGKRLIVDPPAEDSV